MNDNVAALDMREDVDDEGTGFSLDLSELRSMAYRQRFIIGGAILLALVLGFLATLLATPRYAASSTVQIDHRSQQIVSDGDIEGAIRGGDVQRYLQGQVELLKSRKMAARVADDLKLANKDDFLLSMNIEPATETPAGVDLATVRRAQVISALAGNMNVNMPFGSNIATISFNSPSRASAVKVANAYAENLITGNIEQKFEGTSYAREFLEKEIADTKAKLEESEQLALEYANDAAIIDASDGVNTSTDDESTPRSITTTNLIQMNSDVGAAKTERIKAEAKWRLASRAPVMQLPEVLNNPAIQNLQAERARQLNRRKELSDRYKPDHPVYQEVASQISSIDAQIRRLASDIKSGIRADYEISRDQESSLNSDLNELKSATVSEQRKRIQLNLLTREVDTNRALYQSLLERYKAVSASADIVTNNVSIIDKAEGAGQVSPKPFVNLAVALFGGLALGLLLAFVRETFDDSVRSPDDVRRKLGLPVLGTTPLYDGSQQILQALQNRKSAIAEAYASVRSSLDFSTSEGVPGSLLVTSSQPSEGKSTSAIAICESYARAGAKVLLVDADLRLPSLHSYLGVKNTDGFVGVLTGHSRLDAEVQKVTDAGFDFLSCGPVPPDPSGIIATDSIQRFINQYGSGYDLILFDGPPVMGLADSPQMSRAVGGTIIVIEAAKVHGGKTKTTKRRLNDARANILGVLLTKFDDRKNGYGDYYGYSYEYESNDKSQKGWFARLLPGSSD